MIKLLLEQIVRDDSGPVLLRSKLRAVARRMGFADVARERMELVCNEMASNQIKFAGGTGMVQLWECIEPPALDLFVLDYGPGIANLRAALEDGYTTAGTMGKGLGAIRRLADESEFYSLPAGVQSQAPWHGMCAWARFYRDGIGQRHTYQTGCYLRAYQDDRHNGDYLCTRAADGRLRWLHMDGLGHGAAAADAVENMGQTLDMETPLERVMASLSARLQGGRGAVGVVGEVDAAAGGVSVCGVGDMTSHLICNGERRQIVFSPGILGHAHRHLEVLSLTFAPQTLMITASDGVRRDWTLETFPGLWRLHPQLIALLMGQVTARGNDDKSMFIVRHAPESQGGNHGRQDKNG